MRLSGIRAVVFDAVGTLLHPEPPAAEVYAAIGIKFGSRLDPTEIARRFRESFAQEETFDRLHGWRTSETREVERWRHIVANVLTDVTDLESCFAELYEHFTQPSAWRCESDTISILAELSAKGYLLGLASNYDHRLRTVAAGVPGLGRFQQVIISSEVGWRKPAAQFFQAMCKTVAYSASDILYVGDDLVNDYQGARAAGLHAVLFDPKQRASSLAIDRISQMEEILKLLS
jgi:putative hydrolase of the HAD superfamily